MSATRFLRRLLTIEGWDERYGKSLPDVEAWDAGGVWNGWAMPYATAEALALIDENQRAMQEAGDEPTVRFEPCAHGAGWRLIPTDDPDRHSTILPTAETPDGRPLYNLGDLGLCWLWND